MDVSRKFIQMGRTRSLRYALRKGGKKYEPSKSTRSAGAAKAEEDGPPGTYQIKRATGEKLKVIPRTGEVYDEEKLRGAEIFRSYEGMCWADEAYKAAYEQWKSRQGVKKATVENAGDRVKLEQSSENDEPVEHVETREEAENGTAADIGQEGQEVGDARRSTRKRNPATPEVEDTKATTKPEPDPVPRRSKRQRS